MANASAKKAAAARASSSSTYFPIVALINCIYVLFRVILHWETYNKFQVSISILLWSLTIFAYQGILQDAAVNSSNSKKLTGGEYLDLLGLVVVVQLGTVFISDTFVYLLIILPFWGGWKLYKMYKSFSNPFGTDDERMKENKSDEDEELKARRQKRAERRRQKRL